MNASGFTPSAVDWRAQLRINQRRTRFVITIFIVVYVLLGFLVDVYLTAGRVPPYIPISTIMEALLTFQVFPYATVTMAAVAAISIFVTYQFHDRIMLLGTEYHEITPQTARSLMEQQLYNVVEEMKVAASLRYMPKVYLIEADYMNAFASGYSEKSAMVAITRGLIEKLDRAELQAVMAHELSHILHQDIKLTLMASVLANLMLIVLDMLFYSLIFGRDDRNGRNGLVAVIILLRYILPITTILLLLYLSRTREYMADAGCVELTRDNQPLIKALLKIHSDHKENQEAYGAQYSQTPHEDVRRQAYLYDPVQCGIDPVSSLSDLFSTHPTLNDRLKALGYQSKIVE
jgi:heat shock protein HtpX